VLVPAPGMSLRGGVGMRYWLGFIMYVVHSNRGESYIVTLALFVDFVAICPRQSERDLRFSGQSLCSKEEEVVIEEREAGRRGYSEALYREANTGKLLECRNAYATYTYTFLEQEQAT